jgi:threonine/homoserine/homoserine lactone efflux protein
MTVTTALTLFLIMAVLAAIPSSSVALVVIRSASLGLRSGVAVALGIAFGDIVFVALAIAGVAALAEAAGALFTLIRYLAAAYLIWFGVSLMRGGPSSGGWPAAHRTGGTGISFAAGFVLTLGDMKAILFYAALFPALIDVRALTLLDVVTISVVTLVAVSGVKIAYAVAARTIADKASKLPFVRRVRIASGGLLISVGGYLFVKG